MELASSDIRNHSFSSSLRGLDEEEVYAFLDRVADRWDKMEARVNSLQNKIGEIGDTAEKARAAKERAEKMETEMKEKQDRLEEKERELEKERKELEQTKTKLRSVAERLQETLQQEQEKLDPLTSENEAAATPSRNGAPAEPTAAAERPNGTADTGEKSSEEWVDSLFPNRLPGNEEDPAPATGSTADEEAEEDLSASESQFEAIKEDVQGMGDKTSDPSPAAKESEDDEKPPTDEMNQIWDVFDEAAPQ